MESQLGEFEQRYQITRHWRLTDKEFLDARRSYFEEKQQLLHSSIWVDVVKRQFLLKLKAKFAATSIR